MAYTEEFPGPDESMQRGTLLEKAQDSAAALLSLRPRSRSPTDRAGPASPQTAPWLRPTGTPPAPARGRPDPRASRRS